MIVLVPVISFRISGIRAEASNNNFVSIPFNRLISDFSASGLAIVIPIPIAAEWGFFGSIEVSLFAEPKVNLSSEVGSTIKFGEKALADCDSDLGTAVYTRSLPDLSAASDASIGAP